MPSQNLFLAVALISGVTFLLRAAPLTFLAKYTFPPVVRRSLEYIPVSILSVMLVTEIFIRNGQIYFNPRDPFPWAALLTFVVAFTSRNFILTVILGILSSALLKLFIGA